MKNIHGNHRIYMYFIIMLLKVESLNESYTVSIGSSAIGVNINGYKVRSNPCKLIICIMQAAETYRTESTHASIQKSHASQEVNRLRKDLEITKRERDQVCQCTGTGRFNQQNLLKERRLNKRLFLLNISFQWCFDKISILSSLSWFFNENFTGKK